MKLFVYTLDKTLYEGDASVVTLPSETGELSVLPNHAPIVTALKQGNVTVKTSSETKEFPIQSGFAQINQEQTILLVK
jgi:F-type H+-transporting ATPase subunit epsilon